MTPTSSNSATGNSGLTWGASILTVTGSTKINTSLSVGSSAPQSATAGRIDAANDIVAFSTSDLRLKGNIKNIDDSLSKLLSLNGVEFEWKEEHKDVHGYSGKDIGVIAQEIKDVLPEAVRTNDSGYLSVRYEKIVPLIIEALKEQQKQIEALKSIINNK